MASAKKRLDSFKEAERAERRRIQAIKRNFMRIHLELSLLREAVQWLYVGATLRSDATSLLRQHQRSTESLFQSPTATRLSGQMCRLVEQTWKELLEDFRSGIEQKLEIVTKERGKK
jgi:hypothetical protein